MNYSQDYILKCQKAGFDHPLNLSELWELLRSAYPELSDFALLTKTRINMSQCACGSYLQRMDVNSSFLMAYMYGKHKKEWDNKRGQWR